MSPLAPCQITPRTPNRGAAPFVLLSGKLRPRGRVALVAEAQARTTRLAYPQ